MADRGLVYQCLECGKKDQRGRLRKHIYLSHLEKGNIPYYCSLCEFVADSLPGLSNHLTTEGHRSCLSKLEGSFTNESFINIAGDRGIYLQEGKHYSALSTEESEKEWEKRKRIGKRTVTTTAPPTEQPGPSTIRCTIEAEEKSEFPILTFQDLVTFEDGTIFGEAPAPPAPQLQKAVTPIMAPMTPKGAASPAISIRASPSIATSSASSSSSSSSSENERMEIFRQMARGAEQASATSKAQLDVMLSLNENLQQNNKLMAELLKLIQDMKAEKDNEKENAGRSRSPRRRSPHPPRRTPPRRFGDFPYHRKPRNF